MRIFDTREVAKLLGVTPGAIQQAIWHGRLDAPSKGPGEAFLWTLADINRASWVLLHRAFAELPEDSIGLDLQGLPIC